jgi:hypothetical protein
MGLLRPLAGEALTDGRSLVVTSARERNQAAARPHYCEPRLMNVPLDKTRMVGRMP